MLVLCVSFNVSPNALIHSKNYLNIIDHLRFSFKYVSQSNNHFRYF